MPLGRIFLALHDKCIVGHSGGAQPFLEVVSPVSCTSSLSSAGGADGGRRKASNFNAPSSK